MTPEEFTRALSHKAREVEQYAQTRFPTMAGDITLRFINGNKKIKNPISKKICIFVQIYIAFFINGFGYSQDIVSLISRYS